MSIGGVVFLILLTAAVAFWVLRPVILQRWGKPNVAQDAIQKQRERVLTYYERVLSNVRDLDDDLATEKIHPEEHAQERVVWVERGVTLLALLDQLKERAITQENATDAEIDALIETNLGAPKESGIS